MPGRYGVSYTRDIGPVSAKLRGSYGRSIRPPNAGDELAVPQTSSDVLAIFDPHDVQLANPDLAPEHRQGGEGGIELYWGSRGSIVVTRFNETTDNLISYVQYVDSVRSTIPVEPDVNGCGVRVGGGGSIFWVFDEDGYCFSYQNQNLNVGSIRNQGWELQSSVNLGPITTRGTYSWVKSRIIGITPKYRSLLTGSSYQPGRPFDYAPEHVWALSATYTKSRTMVSLSLNGVGMRYVSQSGLTLRSSGFARFNLMRPRMQALDQIYRPLGAGYATADLNASHSLSSRINATLQVTNLGDYYQNDYNAQYATAGRSTRLGLRFRF